MNTKSKQKRLRFKASQQPKEPCRECGLTLLSCGASGLCWECADAAWQAGRTAITTGHYEGIDLRDDLRAEMMRLNVGGVADRDYQSGYGF